MKDKLKGTISIIIATIIFGLMPLFAKIIFKNGGNPISLVFYRFLLSIPALYFINKRNKVDLKITKDEFMKLTVLGILGYSATPILLYISYNYISTGLATTIHFIYPVFVTMACCIFYKEKLKPTRVLSLILCTMGIFLFLNDMGNIDIKGIVLSFISGITFAFYIVYFDKSGFKDVDIFKTTYYLNLISSGALLIFSLITKTFTMNLTSLGWILMIIFSHGVTLVAVSLFQYGIRLVGSQSTSIISTFEPITSVVVGVLIFKEEFNLKIFLGCITILVGVITLSLERDNTIEIKEV